MRYGHMFDRTEYLQMPFDFSNSILFNDQVIEAQASQSEDYDIELNIPMTAFDVHQSNGTITYGGKVEGAPGLVRDPTGILNLGTALSSRFRCEFPDNLSLSTSGMGCLFYVLKR